MRRKKYTPICTLCTFLCTFVVLISLQQDINASTIGSNKECPELAISQAGVKPGAALFVAQFGGKMDYINTERMNEPKTGVLFVDFIEKTATRKAKRMGDSYLKNYHTLIYHVNNFSKIHGATIYTNSVNEDFLDDFIVYLEGLNLKAGYIKNTIGLAKSMARKASNYGFAVDATYDDVEVEADEGFFVYLSMNEITRIYYYKGLSPKQERAKDLFVIGCLTGMRYSDYSTLSAQDFRGGFIDKTTKKTSKRVVIPLHDYVKEIYGKYNGEVSKGLTIQYFNRVIKVVMEKVGLDTPITYTCIKGGKLVTETKKKWELISSHTARRSAATNMYMTGRMKIFEIMAITGHTTEKSFFKYIRVSNEDLSKQIAGDSFFRT